MLTLSWVYRAWLAPKYGYDELAIWIESLALTLTGIGVYHKGTKTNE